MTTSIRTRIRDYLPLLIVVIALCLGGKAVAETRRIALVIGNGAYQDAGLPKLANPTNDAEDIARTLRQFGFKVIEKKNLTLEGMNRAIAEFGSQIGGSDAALFFYAGHGLQVKNQNYLIPVNAVIESESSVPYQAINVNQVLDEIDNAKAGTNIVILDACRNNPISGKFRSGMTRGLAAPGATPKGTVIVYATDPGNVASDGTGRNGLFTESLLKAFKGRDLSLDGVLTEASAQVEKASGQNQTPYINGPRTLQKTFRFDITVEPGPKEIEKTFWNSIANSTNPDDFNAYLAQYPKGSYAALAESRLKKLKPAVAASPPPPVKPAPAAFDGQWNVTLSCEDTNTGGKFAKGYTLTFVGDVAGNRLSAQYGFEGKPGSLTMTGVITADGNADITVNGLTGNPDLTVGSLSRGSPYGYHMRGTFSGNKGQAKRIEVRPCEAVFTR